MNRLLKDENEKNLKKVERLRDECGVDVKITTMVKEGSPARVILETIEEERHRPCCYWKFRQDWNRQVLDGKCS